MSPRGASLLVLSALLAGPAIADPRPLPADASRGVIRHAGEMSVTVNGNPAMLAPGAIIRNQQNLIIVPIALPAQGAWADYLLDRNGQIYRVWLLTPDELAQPVGAQRR